MSREFRQSEWDANVEDDCRQLVRLAVREDLDRAYDWTTIALLHADARGRATLVAGTARNIEALRREISGLR